MSRYIDADLLIENIAKTEDLRTLSTKTIGEAISNTPTADVVEVKHGEWVEKANSYNYSDEDFEYLECSICGNCSPVQNPTPYCSECGAKMDRQ